MDFKFRDLRTSFGEFDRSMGRLVHELNHTPDCRDYTAYTGTKTLISEFRVQLGEIEKMLAEVQGSFVWER